MPKIKLTKKGAIEALPAPDPSGKQTLYWADGSATKSWVCQGNLPSGKSRRITLGPVAALSLEQAWEMARPKVVAMLEGRDPKLTVPQRQLASMTVAEVFEEYLAANSNLAESTITMYRHA